MSPIDRKVQHTGAMRGGLVLIIQSSDFDNLDSWSRIDGSALLPQLEFCARVI